MISGRFKNLSNFLSQLSQDYYSSMKDAKLSISKHPIKLLVFPTICTTFYSWNVIKTPSFESYRDRLIRNSLLLQNLPQGRRNKNVKNQLEFLLNQLNEKSIKVWRLSLICLSIAYIKPNRIAIEMSEENGEEKLTFFQRLFDFLKISKQNLIKNVQSINDIAIFGIWMNQKFMMTQYDIPL
ncbi:MAG: hypothetical protein MHMPM18_003538, partial [Marteilia pararefringens]